MGALAAGPAAATFGAPFDLSAAGQGAAEPRVAVDPTGDAVFAWRRLDGNSFRVQTRARSAAGVLSAVQTLSSSGQCGFDPQVDVDADGDAVFAWGRFDGMVNRIQARARSAAGALSSVQTLSAAGQSAGEPRVAVDADGDAIFVWRIEEAGITRIQARARSSAGVLSAVETLSAAGQNAFNPQVAVAPDGDAVIAWRRSDGVNFRIQVRARSAAGLLSPVQTLSSSGRDANDPRVAIEADGDSVAAWQRSDGTNVRVQARARSAGGVLSAVQTLSAAGQDAGIPGVAVDAGGDAVFAWVRVDGTNGRMQTRVRSPGGALSAVQTLSPAGVDAFNPHLAVAPGGDAVFAWERLEASGFFVIQARERSATSALSAVQTLSDSEQSAGNAQLATDADGDTVATWRRFDGVVDRIQAAIGPWRASPSRISVGGKKTSW